MIEINTEKYIINIPNIINIHINRHIKCSNSLLFSSLFENNVFLVGQHMMQYASTGVPAAPMPSRISAWGIYDVFSVKNDEQIFLAVVSDGQWEKFCNTFNLDNLREDLRFTTNNLRVENREVLLQILKEFLGSKYLNEIFT